MWFSMKDYGCNYAIYLPQSTVKSMVQEQSVTFRPAFAGNTVGSRSMKERENCIEQQRKWVDVLLTDELHAQNYLQEEEYVKIQLGT